MHRDILDELLKFFTSRHEIAFAIDLYQNTDLPAHVNVRTNCAFGRYSSGFFTGSRHAFFSKNLRRYRFVAVCFDQCVLTIDHSRTGFFAQRFD